MLRDHRPDPRAFRYATSPVPTAHSSGGQVLSAIESYSEPRDVRLPSDCRFRARCAIGRLICAEEVLPLTEREFCHADAGLFAGEA